MSFQSGPEYVPLTWPAIGLINRCNYISTLRSTTWKQQENSPFLPELLSPAIKLKRVFEYSSTRLLTHSVFSTASGLNRRFVRNFQTMGICRENSRGALLSPTEVVFHSNNVVFTEIVASLDFDDFEWLD